MKEKDYRPEFDLMTVRLASHIEEYHKLVNQETKTFSWKIFAGFLIQKGWRDYVIKDDLECYSCGQKIKYDCDGRCRPECYCNECLPMDETGRCEDDICPDCGKAWDSGNCFTCKMD